MDKTKEEILEEMEEVTSFDPPFGDLVAGFEWSVGEMMEEFIKSFEDKTILAVECPNCEYVTVPLRCRCPNCYNELDKDDIIELSGEGSLLSYTEAQVELDGEGNFEDLGEAEIIGMVKLDGADSQLFMPIGEADVTDLDIGQEVEPVWKDEAEGQVEDLKYFKPS